MQMNFLNSTYSYKNISQQKQKQHFPPRLQIYSHLCDTPQLLLFLWCISKQNRGQYFPLKSKYRSNSPRNVCMCVCVVWLVVWSIYMYVHIHKVNKFNRIIYIQFLYIYDISEVTYAPDTFCIPTFFLTGKEVAEECLPIWDEYHYLRTK